MGERASKIQAVELSPGGWAVLEGLFPGNVHFIAASEMPYFAELMDPPMVEAGGGLSQPPFWKITQLGRDVFKAQLRKLGRPVPDDKPEPEAPKLWMPGQ